MDYIAASGNFTFSSNYSQACVNITIVDNDVAETLEKFVVNISTSVNRIMLYPGTVVEIVDNDGRGREGGRRINRRAVLPGGRDEGRERERERETERERERERE